MSNVKNIDAKQLKTWLDSGEAVLVDVREPNEFTEWRIPHAMSMPLTNFAKHLPNLEGEKRKIVFQCLAGKRGEMAYNAAVEKFGEAFGAYNLEGGIQAWDQAGFSITRDMDKEASIPLFRQVLITAGSMILLFSLFAIIGWRFGAFLTFLIGGGLLFAGVTGHCAMANLLQKMPWNKKK